MYEKNVSTRVREVKTTGALVPSLSLLSRDTDVVLSPVPSKVVHVDVDLSHLAREAILKSAYSNNFGKMTSIMIRAVDAYKARTGKVVSFSPTTLMKGLNTGRIQQKEASRQAKERVKAMKEREMEQKTQEAGPSSSSAPAPLFVSSAQVPTHTFILQFDTLPHATNAISFLTTLGFYAYPPPAPVTIGRVFGIKFNSTIQQRQDYLKVHADKVPSLSFTAVKHTDQYAQYRDYMYFIVATSELQQALLLPHMNGTNRLRFEEFKRPHMYCAHCFSQGHVLHSCPYARIYNKDERAKRGGACCGCFSFDHAYASCPVMNSSKYACPLCHKGKHSARTCPLYTGSYVVLSPDKSVAMNDHASVRASDTNPNVGSHTVWSRSPHVPSTASSTSVVHVPAVSSSSSLSSSSSTERELRNMIKELREEIKKDKQSQERRNKNNDNNDDMKTWIKMMLDSQMTTMTNMFNAFCAQVMTARTLDPRITYKEGEISIGNEHAHLHDNTSLIARTSETHEQTDAQAISSHATSKKSTRLIDPKQPSIQSSFARTERSMTTETSTPTISSRVPVPVPTTPSRVLVPVPIPASSLSSIRLRGGLKFSNDDDDDTVAKTKTKTKTVTTTGQETITVDMTTNESEQETDTGDGEIEVNETGKEKKKTGTETEKKCEQEQTTTTPDHDDSDDCVFSEKETTSTGQEDTEQENTDTPDDEDEDTTEQQQERTSVHKPEGMKTKLTTSVSFSSSASRTKRKQELSPDKPDEERIRTPRTVKKKKSNGQLFDPKRGKKGVGKKGKDGQEKEMDEDTEMDDENTNTNNEQDATAGEVDDDDA